MTTLSSISMRRGLKTVMVVQVLLAILLVLADIDARWLPRWNESENLPTGPVSPGDQVRRYDPNRFQPSYTAPGMSPDFFPPEDMPERLEFVIQEAGEDRHLLIHGAIEPGDAQRFEAYLASLGDLTIPVALHSPGGVVKEALEIGRQLRSSEATTVILPGMACVSACPYMLAGGVERIVSLQGAVGLHQHYYETPGLLPAFLAVEQVQVGQGKTMEHLIEMGVEPALMLFSLNTPPDDIYVLVEDELLESRIATSVTE